jgi:hypothetical protein
MTHDELLEKINDLFGEGSNPGAPTNPTYDSMLAFETALMEVVKLHRPSEELFSKVEFMSGIEANYLVCEHCNGLVDNPKITVIYPCRTIRGIEYALEYVLRKGLSPHPDMA